MTLHRPVPQFPHPVIPGWGMMRGAGVQDTHTSPNPVPTGASGCGGHNPGWGTAAGGVCPQYGCAQSHLLPPTGATGAPRPRCLRPRPLRRPPFNPFQPSGLHPPPRIPPSSILHPCIPRPSCSIPHPPSEPPPASPASAPSGIPFSFSSPWFVTAVPGMALAEQPGRARPGRPLPPPVPPRRSGSRGWSGTKAAAPGAAER